MLLPEVTDLLARALLCGQAAKVSDHAVRDAHALRIADELWRCLIERMLRHLKHEIVDLFELIEEPRVDAGHLSDLLDRVSLRESVPDVGQAFGMRRDQAIDEDARLDAFGSGSLAGFE